MDEMSQQEMQRQPMQQGQTSFQTATLTPDLAEVLVKDDSPDCMFDKFWQFFGVDIPVSVILPWDFANILDFVDVAIIDLLQDYPEKEWDGVAIVAYELREVDGVMKNVPIRAYKVVELWSSMRSKVYMKMCRAREGFTLKQLTESKSSSTIEERVHNTSLAIPINAQGAMQQKPSRWRFW